MSPDLTIYGAYNSGDALGKLHGRDGDYSPAWFDFPCFS